MRKVLLIIAFIIFANPFFSSVDIVPDFIGYLLVLIALSRPSYHDEKAKNAYKCAKNVLFVSIARFLSIGFITLALDTTMSLLLSFSFFILEMVFGIPFLLKLFDYYAYRALKTDNTCISNALDKVKIATIVLFVARLLLSTLPDFILLTAGDPLSIYNNDMSGFRPLLVVASFLLSLLITVAWIPLHTVIIAKLFNKKENSEQKQIFEETVKHKKLQYALNTNRIAFILIGVLSLLAFEFRLDNINVICNTVLPFVFITIYVFFLIKKYIKLDKLFFALVGTTIVQFIFFMIVHIKTKAYFKEYTLESVIKVSRAETMYFNIVPFVVVSAILFTTCISFMLYLLIKSGKEALEKNFEVVLPNSDLEFALNEYKTKARVLGIVTTSFAFLSSLFSPIVFALMPRIDELTKIKIFGFETSLAIIPSVIPMQFVLTLCFVIMMIATLLVLHDNSYKKLQEAISLD